MKCFTIGYGGRAPQDFAALLAAHGVRTVVDVRAIPERASMGSYVKAKTRDKGIEKLLGGAGIEYVSMKALGNPFKDDVDWKRRYAELMQQEGLERVQPLFALEGPICLLCAEKHVDQCHRLFIGNLLQAKGHQVEHIV